MDRFSLKKKPKVRLVANKKETIWKKTYSLNINPSPAVSHNQKENSKPQFLPKRKNFGPHIGQLTFQYLPPIEKAPKVTL